MDGIRQKATVTTAAFTKAVEKKGMFVRVKMNRFLMLLLKLSQLGIVDPFGPYPRNHSKVLTSQRFHRISSSHVFRPERARKGNAQSAAIRLSVF
jgi:hypothetical protein